MPGVERVHRNGALVAHSVLGLQKQRETPCFRSLGLEDKQRKLRDNRLTCFSSEEIASADLALSRVAALQARREQTRETSVGALSQKAAITGGTRADNAFVLRLCTTTQLSRFIELENPASPVIKETVWL